jgi:hypothetical protein
MIFLGLWLLVLGVSMTEAANFNQQTGGSCSPIVGQTGGNVIVTINCPGMDSKLLDGLNRELGLARGQLQLTKLELEQITKKANEMERKHQDLSRQFEALQDSKLQAQGKALLNDWKLGQADNLLKQSTVSMAHYNAVQKGMSYQQVVNIVGRSGMEEARSGAGDITVTLYKWKNPDQSYLGVTFINDQMTAKHNEELR